MTGQRDQAEDVIQEVCIDFGIAGASFMKSKTLRLGA